LSDKSNLRRKVAVSGLPIETRIYRKDRFLNRDLWKGEKETRLIGQGTRSAQTGTVSRLNLTSSQRVKLEGAVNHMKGGFSLKRERRDTQKS